MTDCCHSGTIADLDNAGKSAPGALRRVLEFCELGTRRSRELLVQFCFLFWVTDCGSAGAIALIDNAAKSASGAQQRVLEFL